METISVEDHVQQAAARRDDGLPNRRLLVTRGLAVCHVLAVGWLMSGGNLYIDDIRAQAYAAGRPLWPFIIESNGTHLAPGARTVDWFMARHAPLEHWPAVVGTLMIAALLGVATLRLVPRVIAHPVGQVLATSWVLFAASVVPTYAWFRQALTTMLPLALLLLATSFVLDHVRSSRGTSLGAAVGLHVVALTFSERALAFAPVVAALLLLNRPPATSGSGSRWRRAALTLAPFVLTNVVFLIAYASGEYDRAEGSRPGVADAVVKVGRWALVDLVPLWAGGPARWRPASGAYSFADTPPVVVASAVTVLLLGLLVAWRTAGSLRATAPVAAVAAAYALPVVAMVYVGRLAQVDDVAAADDLRLLPDVAAVMSIALAALVGSVLERRGRPATRTRYLAATLGCAATVLTVASWLTFGGRWHSTSVTGYLDTMRTEVRSTSSQVLATPLPPGIVPGWVDATLTTAPLIELLDRNALSSELSGTAVVVGPSGALVPAELGRVAGADVPPGFCGQVLPVGSRSRAFQLTEDAPYYRGSAVVLGVLVGDAERINVRVVDRDGVVSAPLVEEPPELLRGPHRVIASVPYGTAVRRIVIDVESANTDGVCVTSAQVVTVEGAS